MLISGPRAMMLAGLKARPVHLYGRQREHWILALWNIFLFFCLYCKHMMRVRILGGYLDKKFLHHRLVAGFSSRWEIKARWERLGAFSNVPVEKIISLS